MKNKPRCLVTGANGFIGRSVCKKLAENGYLVRAAVRSYESGKHLSIPDTVYVGGINTKTSWDEALSEIDCVIHLAARVHVMNENAADPEALYREVNSLGTAHLADEAAKRGVKRFVYLSSIKVNGELTATVPFTESDKPNPTDYYGISKADAENILHKISIHTGIEVVIIRPPLVYGPGVGGNFLRLLKLVKSGLPLPLSMIHNARSMVSLTNLTDFIFQCLTHPSAGGKTFLVSDGADLSTPELVSSISRHMRLPVKLFPLPPSLLKSAGTLTGQRSAIDRLCDSLQLDITSSRKILGWTPPQRPDEGIAETVEWYESNHGN